MTKAHRSILLRTRLLALRGYPAFPIPKPKTPKRPIYIPTIPRGQSNPEWGTDQNVREFKVQWVRERKRGKRKARLRLGRTDGVSPLERIAEQLPMKLQRLENNSRPVQRM